MVGRSMAIDDLTGRIDRSFAFDSFARQNIWLRRSEAKNKVCVFFRHFFEKAEITYVEI